MGGFETGNGFLWVQDLEALEAQYLGWNTITWLIMNSIRLKTTGKMITLNWVKTGMTPTILQTLSYALGF